MQIYIDESGSIVNGLRSDASSSVPYFVMAALVLKEDLPIKRCIKAIREKKIKKKYKKSSELKFHGSDDNIRRRIIECIGRTNNDIGYALLRNADIHHEVEPQLIYNDICRQLIYKIISNCGINGQVDVIIDKSLYGDRRTAFNDYVIDRTGIMVPDGLEEIRVKHVDSKQCPYLQAVDFIAGSINRKYRGDGDLYYQKILHRIKSTLVIDVDKIRSE